jgi:hypothetical protein
MRCLNKPPRSGVRGYFNHNRPVNVRVMSDAAGEFIQLLQSCAVPFSLRTGAGAAR